MRWQFSIGGQTLRPLRLVTLEDGRRALILRTSDRQNFRSCRRKWGFSSHLQMNLGPRHLAAPLWYGSAVHYALEDFHGYNVFGHPAEAFRAYCIATAKNWKRDLPGDAQEHLELGKATLDYYETPWLNYPRTHDKTYWCPNQVTGVLEPQVEVTFEIPIPIHLGSPILLRLLQYHQIDVVLYRGTLDRVILDEWDRLWIGEYKTAKQFMKTHFPIDGQCTAYTWACEQIYDKPVAGVIYQQHWKKAPKPPNILSTGKLSTSMMQGTSSVLYADTMTSLYGSIDRAPLVNQQFWTALRKTESEKSDRYIARDVVERNDWQSDSELQKILLELEDVLNPDLPLYPNPTRDCSRMCSFLTPCINLDDGSDWKQVITDLYEPRDLDIDRFWRKRLPSPADLKAITDTGEEIDLKGLQEHSKAVSQEEWDMARIAADDPDLPEWILGRGGYDPKTGVRDPFEGLKEGPNGSPIFNMAEVD